MAKGSKGHRRTIRWAPYPHPECNSNVTESFQKKYSDKNWEDVTCSVCMECPHNAVLLLCASHDNGCRPFMCGTSFRFSNCLDQYKKAYTKIITSPPEHQSTLKCEVSELACPLCRGQVKGFTVVEPARDFFNAKRRNCMQDNCSFVGNYKELRKHMKANHPCAQPREIDPDHEQKWRRLEREREHDDVMSTIRSTMPGAMVFGDYVIEQSPEEIEMEEGGGLEVGFDGNLVNVLLLLHAFGPSREDGNNDDDDGDGNEMSLVSRLRRHGRLLLGRSGRRRRRRNIYDAE